MDTQPLSDEESGMYEFPHLPVETPVLNLETAAPEVLEETTMDQEAVIETASPEAVREAASPEAVAEEMEPKGSFEWFEEFDQVYNNTPPDPVPIPGDAMTGTVPLSKGDAKRLAQEDSSSDTPPRYAWKGRVQPLSLAASSAASSGENPFSIYRACR